MTEPTVTTSFRMTQEFKAQLQRIARAERRPLNNWVRLVLEDAVKAYLEDHPELASAPEFRAGVGQAD